MLINKALTPVQLAGLRLRNRIIKTATFEGMTPGGIPSERLINFHSSLAKAGVGLTTVAYCAVSADGRTFQDQMFMHDGIASQIDELTDSVHKNGGAICAQLAHCGFFSKNRELTIRRPLGPSFCFNSLGLMSGFPFGGAMTNNDIEATIADYGNAAAFVKKQGFDAIEIHMGHGYLLSQFLSPAINRRKDDYGRSFENRLRLPLAVVKRIRDTVGDDFPLLAKINLHDGIDNGIDESQSPLIAQQLEQAGINAIVMSGGITSRTPLYLLRGDAPLQDMIAVEKNILQKLTLKILGPRLIKPMPFTPLFFLDYAKRVQALVKIPLVYLGGVQTPEDIEKVMQEGFDFVALGRALIRDPEMIHKLINNHPFTPDCNLCNKCVVAMETPNGVRCVRYEEDFINNSCIE